MQLALEHFALDAVFLEQMILFRDWLKTADAADGSSYDEARMLCRDLGDYLGGRWQTTPERATEVLISELHDLVFTLQRHGFATHAGADAERVLAELARFNRSAENIVGRTQ